MQYSGAKSIQKLNIKYEHAITYTWKSVVELIKITNNNYSLRCTYCKQVIILNKCKTRQLAGKQN